jgi:hypothetical protein
MCTPASPRSALIKSFYWSNASNKYKTLDTRYASKNPVAASRHRYTTEVVEISSKNGIFRAVKALISTIFQISDNSSMTFGAGTDLGVGRVHATRVAESDEAV